MSVQTQPGLIDPRAAVEQMIRQELGEQPTKDRLVSLIEGAASNRSAIGARLELRWNGKTQVQEVAAATGFSAQNQRRVHYGLGTATAVDRVVIRWPSGTTQTIEGPAIDRLHTVKEPMNR